MPQVETRNAEVIIAALEIQLSMAPIESRSGRPHAAFQTHHDFASRSARITPRRTEFGGELLCVEHEAQLVHGYSTERQRLNSWSPAAYLESPFTVISPVVFPKVLVYISPPCDTSIDSWQRL
jgi:hypothetical protein